MRDRSAGTLRAQRFRRRDSKAGSTTSVEIGSDRPTQDSDENSSSFELSGADATSVGSGRDCLRCSNVASVIGGAIRALEQGETNVASEMLDGALAVLGRHARSAHQ